MSQSMMNMEMSFVEETNDVANKRFSCHLCEFKNTDKGGMTRHFNSKHKGTKRGPHDSTTNAAEPSADEMVDKRAKLDDDFEPDFASTQLSDNDELDEFDEALLADVDDLDTSSVTIAQCSNETIARIVNETNFNLENRSGKNKEKEATKETQNKSIVSAVLQADFAISSSRMKGMENELKAKDLLLAENGLEINNLETENTELKNKLSTKDKALETNLAMLNTVEEQLVNSKSKCARSDEKLKTNMTRTKLLEKAVKKYMNKAASGSPNPTNVLGEDAEDFAKLKEIIAKKNAEIKELVTGKITLANELKIAQELIGGESATIEKCTKLTNDVKAKNTALKATEKEKSNLKDSLGKMQTEMNMKNNKLAHLEAENIKLNDFNNKMYEICKKSRGL